MPNFVLSTILGEQPDRHPQQDIPKSLIIRGLAIIELVNQMWITRKSSSVTSQLYRNSRVH
jgi:hypothetical protein